jgi:alpha-D-xyloside xylohydrolase
MRAAMVWYDELRYRLMPYIYTLAADTYHKDGSMMRGLVMDFPNDPKVNRIADEYLWGKAFLVAPVTSFKARERDVYLPASTDWYDFNTGKRYAGGQTISAPAPYTRMPVFVRAGSIIPMGPVQHYVDEKPDAPLTLLVYPGADGVFILYDDDGVSRKFEQGEFSRIPIAYNDAEGVLAIGGWLGHYAGMPTHRQLIIRWMKDGSGVDGSDGVSTPIDYDGGPVVIKRP